MKIAILGAGYVGLNTAAAFAWLARQSLLHRPGNLPAVTGATRAAILGAIHPG